MESLLFIAGGVAFVLFGVRHLREGLDRLFGARLGEWMQRLARDPLRASLTGIGISLVAPSSTTMSILAVQTVQAGELSARQMLAVMLGADVGITVTVQLLALHIEQYAPLFALVGVVLFQFTRSQRWRGVGQVVLSLAFLFIGIGVIKVQASGIDPAGDLVQLLQIAEHYPLAMVLFSAVLANAIQSSTATVGLLIAVGSAQSSAMPLGLAIAGVVGANIGVTLTTLMVGWRQIESRRLALSNLVAKLAVAAIFVYFLPRLTILLAHTPGGLTAQIANAHTGFNVIKLLLFLPIVGTLSSMVEHCAPASSRAQTETFGPRYVRVISDDSPALAMGQSMREIMRLAEIVRTMLDDLWRAMNTDDEELARNVSRRDDQVDLLDKEIRKYLIHLATRGLDQDQAAEQMRQLRYLAELESIGDIIDKNLCELVLKKIRKGVKFSDECHKELEDFDQKVLENLLIADTAFHTRDRVLAEKLLRHKHQIDSSVRELRDKHFARLNAGVDESREPTSIHLDLLTNLRRINSHVSHVAYAVLYDMQNRQSSVGA